MTTLVLDKENKFRIVQSNGETFFAVLSGGVFEQEIIIRLYDAEVPTLLSDVEKRLRLARLIVKNPGAFEERRVRDVSLP